MSEYTTGELAKLGNVSVRTLQFYDKKALLYPSTKTESGKRIYNDDDLKRLKLILLLKSLGLSLDAIAEILDSEDSSNILSLMLQQQEKVIKQQVAESKSQLKVIESIQRNLPDLENISLKTIDDIDTIMENKKSLRKVHRNLILIGIPLDIIEIGTLVYGIMTGHWLPFILGMIVVIAGASWLTIYYFNQTNYICPHCNYEFKPTFWKAFSSRHNSRARKLTCPNCGETNYCVEVYDETKREAKV